MRFRRHVIIFSLLVALIAALLIQNSPLVRSQTPTPQRIESDDPSVTRAGNWTSQTASQASGSSYLYSSGAEADVMTLQFSGPSVEVIFVTGPSLGTLAINVDDIVLRTVITTAEQTAYRQSSRIDYLSDEPHTLKVYAQAGGVVGVDAFVVTTSPPTDETTASGQPRDPFCAPTNQIHRVSLTSTGGQADDGSINVSISGDGRFVAFMSVASLVPGDGDTEPDIYLYDRATCATELISVSTSGEKANDITMWGLVSEDGRYVAIESSATNLVSNDTNGQVDIFVRDRQTNITTRVSVATDGTEAIGGPSYITNITPDGRYIVFTSYANNLVAGDSNNNPDVFVHDRQTGITSRASFAYDGTEISRASSGVISADGRYVAFVSSDNSVVADDTNGTGSEIFVRDRQNETTTRVSVATGGVQTATGRAGSPAISSDGRYVAFYSGSNDLVSGDTNGFEDVFVHDRDTNTTTRVSVASDGTQIADRNSLYPVLSYDGRYIAFLSSTSDPIAGTGSSYAYVHDQQTGITSLVAVPETSLHYFSVASPRPILSGDGQFVAFASDVATLVSNDTNDQWDIFVTPRFSGASNLTAAALDDGRIQLNWVDNASDETEYRLERSPDGLNNWVEIGTAPANTTTYTNVSLICGTPYYYRVRAYRSGDGIFSAYSDVATATTDSCLPAAPTNLTATTHSQTSIQLAWTDNASDETNFGIERSFNGTTDWSQIGSTVTNVNTFTDTVYLACGTPYYYRVRAYRSGDGVFSAYSNTTNANTAPCRPDALALINPATRSANLIHTLTNPPAGGDYTQFATGLPFGPGGQYVMGDWDGDGVDTIGVYREGAFFFTNDFGTGGTWGGIWFGLGGQAVVGRFDATVNHDCLGVTDSGTWTNGDTYFALYFTCNLTSGPTPPLTFQWLSILLPNSQGFTGTFQFVAGDFNGDGVDSVAVRRGAFIAWTNVPPTILLTQFNLAQYFGAPGTGDEGKIMAGDWDMNNVDSFGLVYQNGMFYRRNDVEWNSGVYILQQFTPLVGTPFDVASWRPH